MPLFLASFISVPVHTYCLPSLAKLICASARLSVFNSALLQVTLRLQLPASPTPLSWKSCTRAGSITLCMTEGTDSCTSVVRTVAGSSISSVVAAPPKSGPQ